MSAQVTIKPYTAPAAEVNEYLDTVKALIEAGPDSAGEVKLDAKFAGREYGKIQRAANELDRTARVRERDESNVVVEGQNDKGKDILSGYVVLTFQLTPKNAPRRGKDKTADAETVKADK